MIDEETFDLAQKRIATKHRPTKCDEIDLFSGLLFCGDCGYKMYLQQGAGTLERKHAYTCGRYRNRIRTGEVCTTHYIRKSVLKELVLGDIQRVLSYVKAHEQQFIADATEYGDVKTNRALREKRGELDKAKARLGELEHLFRKLYEDNALGRLSDQQFTFMVSGYDDEKAALVEKIRGSMWGASCRSSASTRTCRNSPMRSSMSSSIVSLFTNWTRIRTHEKLRYITASSVRLIQARHTRKKFPSFARSAQM